MGGGGRAVDALVLVLLSGVGAGQATQRHQPHHEAKIGVRFAGLDQLVHLIGLGEVMPRLGRGFVEFLYGSTRAGEGFPNGNQPVSFARHGLSRFALSAEPGLRQIVGRLETHPEIGVRPTGRFEL